MTGFWFLLFMFLMFFGIYYKTMSMSAEKPEISTDKNMRPIVALFASIFVVGYLVLAYHAGVFVYVTDYSGSLSAFVFWLIFFIGFSIHAIIKSTTPFIMFLSSLFQLFLIYQIGGLANLQLLF
jgi:hypothetical protein